VSKNIEHIPIKKKLYINKTNKNLCSWFPYGWWCEEE